LSVGFRANLSIFGDGNLSDFVRGGLSSIGKSAEGGETDVALAGIERAPVLLLNPKRTPNEIRQINASQAVLGTFDPSPERFNWTGL
jgi:hypothetical protein